MLQNRIIRFEYEALKNKAVNIFLRMNELNREKPYSKLIKDKAFPVLEALKSEINPAAVISYYGSNSISLSENGLKIKDETIRCKAFERFKPETVKGVYICFISIGSFNTDKLTSAQQLIADMWGTAFIDSIRDEIINKLSADSCISEEYGPGFFGMDTNDMNKCLMMTIRDKSYLHQLLDKCCEWLSKRIDEYKKAGANGVFIAEPTAGLLSPDACDEFSSVYIKKLVELYQDDYFFLILHDCGRVTKSVKSMCATGCKGLHFGNGVNMKDIMPQVDSDILAFGNLDPSSVFFMGTPEYVYEKTTSLLEEMKPYPNFVLSSGCDLAPTVNEENIRAYFAACNDFNKNK